MKTRQYVLVLHFRFDPLKYLAAHAHQLAPVHWFALADFLGAPPEIEFDAQSGID